MAKDFGLLTPQMQKAVARLISEFNSLGNYLTALTAVAHSREKAELPENIKALLDKLTTQKLTAADFLETASELNKQLQSYGRV